MKNNIIINSASFSFGNDNKQKRKIVKEISFEEFKACENKLIYGNPFLRPSIFEITWKNLYKSRKVVILALYDDEGETIQSVLPCYRGVNWRNGIPLKYCDGFPTRYGGKVDVLSTEENKEEAFVEFIQYVIDQKSYWDRIVLSNIPHKQALALREWLVKQDMTVSLHSSYVRVARKMNSFEEYMQHQADHREMQRYQSYWHRYLKRKDPVSFQVFHDDNVLDTIFDIGNRSWKAPLKTNIAHPELKSFISELVRYLSSINALRIFILSYQDSPIAYDLYAILNKCCYGVKSDYDEAYKALSPGNVLRYLSIKHIHENEPMVESFDFISNYPYLKTWTNQTAQYATVTIFRNNAKGRLLNFAMNRLKPLIKGQFARLNRKEK